MLDAWGPSGSSVRQEEETCSFDHVKQLQVASDLQMKEPLLNVRFEEALLQIREQL